VSTSLVNGGGYGGANHGLCTPTPTQGGAVAAPPATAAAGVAPVTAVAAAVMGRGAAAGAAMEARAVPSCPRRWRAACAGPSPTCHHRVPRHVLFQLVEHFLQVRGFHLTDTASHPPRGDPNHGALDIPLAATGAAHRLPPVSSAKDRRPPAAPTTVHDAPAHRPPAAAAASATAALCRRKLGGASTRPTARTRPPAGRPTSQVYRRRLR
jgi:hypothetical protein